MKTLFAYLLIASLVTPLAIVYIYQDDLAVVFNSWLSGEPKIMVKLEIHIPPVQAELCTVHVRKLPTPYRPTETGFSEQVYAGLHRPGDTVVVKELHAAIVAKARIEKGEYKVEYYEPVEYLIVVLCKKGGTALRYGRIHEVYPISLVTTHVVEVKFEEKPGERYPSYYTIDGGGGSSTNPLLCNFYSVTPPPGALEAAECITLVRGPYLYSLPGLETAFGVKGEGEAKPSAVYLEAYWDSAYCPVVCERDTPQQWSSAGKRLTTSWVSGETASLSGRFRDRVYFSVLYRYEKWYTSYDGFAGIGELYWIIYPLKVKDIQRSESLYPITPYEKEYLSVVEPAPSYAGEPVWGDRIIWFTPAKETDEVLVGTSVSFSFTFGVFTLTVNLYKAGRYDQIYTTPYLRVRDVSGSTTAWYYWWFANNDPMLYEVRFSNYR
ncbi:MAG: hypothetical protein QXE68_05420 [Sulfolobales archaeon]